MTSTKAEKVQTPFTSGAIDTDIAFWTGPGNIATRLAPYFDQIVGSDVNDAALAAAPHIVPKEYQSRMHFLNSPAEALAQAPIPEAIGKGNTDLAMVGECIPLLDREKSLEAFHAMLRPGGTLAIYFYGRPIFTGGDAARMDALYDKIATRICQFLWPIKETPGFPFFHRAAEAMESWLDNIAFPADQWEKVERHKWNDFPLLMCAKEGFDFEFDRVDRRGVGEVAKDTIDRSFWSGEWDAGRVANFLSSAFPNYEEKAGEKYAEIEKMVKDMSEAIHFPGCSSPGY
ncbi:hypothetical protein BS50DRAFT_617204 [Corynespora cassiicola Philippines]|uniref:Methyltransferase type 11 domain-containing protein n=1 Tax=Corynespora cassiicola Philippines TaxID=1448308 RepID=A0A2T2P286_CORCC|nr:hypothetical protein BS50DRAFT_617204 [Corynespora cassiicola Philippines]